jgi:hypothetical protein
MLWWRAVLIFVLILASFVRSFVFSFFFARSHHIPSPCLKISWRREGVQHSGLRAGLCM